MVSATIWGRVLEMQGGPWAFVVYHQQFRSDLLTDIAAAYKKDPMELTDFLRFGWAMCRTYSDDVPDFEHWCKDFPDFGVSNGEGATFVSVVSSALEAEVFRPCASRFARWRRALRSRWLGWLQKRCRA